MEHLYHVLHDPVSNMFSVDAAHVSVDIHWFDVLVKQAEKCRESNFCADGILPVSFSKGYYKKEKSQNIFSTSYCQENP